MEINMLVKKMIRQILKKFDIGITRFKTFENLQLSNSASRNIEMLQKLNNENAQQLIKYLSKSKSQLGQDLFVLSRLAFKRNGYFVEFGATNGRDISNTYLMEKEFGWNGVLAEPATIWHEDLKKNRNCCVETYCVWKDSNSTLIFNQSENAEYSTIKSYLGSDSHKNIRRKGLSYPVKTISLNDLLLKYNAPKHIDYLSIDTEGSEYEILSHFDFSKYSFSVITCEHNFTPMRELLHSLLTSHGYQRVFEELSLWDDWYVSSTSARE
jgi:FkbM family methyltransferase